LTKISNIFLLEKHQTLKIIFYSFLNKILILLNKNVKKFGS